MLPTSAFESKSKFILLLRKEFQGGTFSLSGSCTNRDVIEYYRWLKRDFEFGEQRQCSMMNYVGFQGDQYWCLSDQVCSCLFVLSVPCLYKSEGSKKRCAG